MIKFAQISDAHGGVVSVEMMDGTCLRFHALWLRDNVIDAQTRAAAGGQRMITLADIPIDVSISKVDVNHATNTLQVRFSPEDKEASFCVSWLQANAYDIKRPVTKGWVSPAQVLWTPDTTQPPVVSFDELSTDAKKLESWLAGFEQFGYARVVQGPRKQEALFEVVKLFGEVRVTNYGKLFDVKVSPNPSNLAFTNQGLQAHTDNPYRHPRPSVQLLYCLENSAAGGESVLIDGFAAAKRLQSEDPNAFDLLTRYPVDFEYKSLKDQVHLLARGPMIELDSDNKLMSVRFNSRSIAPIKNVPFSDMTAYYQAYRKFSDIIDDPGMGISFKLEPGECVVMDNTRVLHSRLAYSGSGERWLQGCYSDLDGIYSTLAALRARGNLDAETPVQGANHAT